MLYRGRGHTGSAPRPRSGMEYRRLGTTGLQISRLGLGCGNFGGVGSAPAFYGMGESEDEAFALMDRAREAGINFFDTPEAYGGGPRRTFFCPRAHGEGAPATGKSPLPGQGVDPGGDGA